jgi:hypothetical protein
VVPAVADRVLLVATHHRTNLTMRQLAPLYGIELAAVHRIIGRLDRLPKRQAARRRRIDVV